MPQHSIGLLNVTKNLYTTSRLLNNQYARELKCLGVTVAQAPVLVSLSENEGITQDTIASSLFIAKSATALVVKQLTEKGLVKRTKDKNDKRAYNLFLTQKGSSLIPKILDIVHEIQIQVLEKLTEYERIVFTGILEKVTEQAAELFGDG